MQQPETKRPAVERVREQRKEKRFRTKSRTLARVSVAPDLLFHIVDISRGGLAFRYLGDTELSDRLGEVDILFDDKFTLGKLAVHPVSDSPIEYGYIPMRRRSVRFAELTPWQKAELDHFLMNCTAPERQ